MFRKTLCAIALIFVISVVFSAGALADVYPQSQFHYEGFGGVYDGACLTYINFSTGHFVDACHAKLTSGTTVTVTTKLVGDNLHGVITPSGTMTETIVVS